MTKECTGERKKREKQKNREKEKTEVAASRQRDAAFPKKALVSDSLTKSCCCN